MLLRPWTIDDAPALFRLSRSAPDLVRQLPPLDDLAACRALIERFAQPGGRAFALTENGVPIGNVGISDALNAHRNGWFHYWMGAETRGRGLASRAAATVATWALDEGGLFRLELGHRVENLASGRVAERAGFIAEGIERAKLLYDGVRHDVRTMSRLATDPVPGLQPIRLVLE